MLKPVPAEALGPVAVPERQVEQQERLVRPVPDQEASGSAPQVAGMPPWAQMA